MDEPGRFCLRYVPGICCMLYRVDESGTLIGMLSNVARTTLSGSPGALKNELLGRTFGILPASGVTGNESRLTFVDGTCACT